MPPILSTRNREFNGACLCAHAQKAIPMVLIRPFTKQIASTVSVIIYPKLMQIVFIGCLYGCYKELPSMKTIFTCIVFSSLIHRTLFHGLAGACVNPLFVHSLVCPITHSFLNGFQSNLAQHFSHVCSTCHNIFSLKKTLECVYERLLRYSLIFTITWTPDKSFA